MSSQLISNSLISKLQPRPQKYDVRDTKLTGFLIRVYPSGKMSYVVQYQRGKRTTIAPVGVITPKQARERATQILAESLQGKLPSQNKNQTNQTTLENFIKHDYEKWALANLNSGRKTVDRIFTAFPDFLPLALDKITVRLVDQWRTKMLNQQKPATINRSIGTLKALLSKAVVWNVIDEHPIAQIKPLKVDANPIVRYLTSEEEQRLFTALHKRKLRLQQERASANEWRKARRYPLLTEIKNHEYAEHIHPMIEVSITTGLRKGELTSLKKSQVNLNQRYLSQLGKNGKTRHIPLNDIAHQALKTWMAQTNSEYVFPSPENPNQPIGSVSSAWKTLLKEAKITHFRWHDLRHHFASKLVMAGVDLNTVRELLGHSDIKMTLRYAHLAPEHKANAVAKLQFNGLSKH